MMMMMVMIYSNNGLKKLLNIRLGGSRKKSKFLFVQIYIYFYPRLTRVHILIKPFYVEPFDTLNHPLK